MSGDLSFQAYAESLAVIANPIRFRIAFALLDGPLSAKRLALAARTTTKGVFYHLALMERAGIVSATEIDKSVQYSLCGSWAELDEGGQGFQLRLGAWRVTLLTPRD